MKRNIWHQNYEIWYNGQKFQNLKIKLTWKQIFRQLSNIFKYKYTCGDVHALLWDYFFLSQILSMVYGNCLFKIQRICTCILLTIKGSISYYVYLFQKKSQKIEPGHEKPKYLNRYTLNISPLDVQLWYTSHCYRPTVTLCSTTM